MGTRRKRLLRCSIILVDVQEVILGKVVYMDEIVRREAMVRISRFENRSFFAFLLRIKLITLFQKASTSSASGKLAKQAQKGCGALSSSNMEYAHQATHLLTNRCNHGARLYKCRKMPESMEVTEHVLPAQSPHSKKAVATFTMYPIMSLDHLCCAFALHRVKLITLDMLVWWNMLPALASRQLSKSPSSSQVSAPARPPATRYLLDLATLAFLSGACHQSWSARSAWPTTVTMASTSSPTPSLSSTLSPMMSTQSSSRPT